MWKGALLALPAITGRTSWILELWLVHWFQAGVRGETLPDTVEALLKRLYFLIGGMERGYFTFTQPHIWAPSKCGAISQITRYLPG